MPEPHEFQVVQSLQDALQTITVGGGYHYTVNPAAVLLDLDPGVEALTAPGGFRPFIVLELGEERWELVEKPFGLLLVVPWTIYWVHDMDPTNEASFLQTYYRGCADVERAIAADVNRGGLATETRIVQRTPSRIGAQVWATIDGDCRVYRTYGQPDV